MRQILPGKPQAKLQAISAAIWDRRCIVVRPWKLSMFWILVADASKAYISGNALIVLGGPNDLIQTIYHDDSVGFDAVSVDKLSGKIAISNEEDIYIYRPYGRDEDVLKVAHVSTPLTRKPLKLGCSGHYNAVLKIRKRNEEPLPYLGG